MSTLTTNLGLTKPALTDNADISVINANMDAIDSKLATIAFVQSTLAALASSTPTLMSTLQQIDAALNNDPNLYTDVMAAINTALSTSETYTNGITGALSALSTVAKANLVAALNEINSNFNAHLAEIASQTQLGHVKVDGISITADANGVISAIPVGSLIYMYKNMGGTM